MPHSIPSRLLRFGALLAVAFIAASAARAQAQYAGTYIGIIGNRVSIPGVTTIEASVGGYSATVGADGSFNLNQGALTGTVSASGAVSITGGTTLAQLGIRSAQIANNQLSSNYGDTVANGTTQFRLLTSTSFTAAPGGGGNTGGGGSTGGIDTPDLAQAALRGKTLTFTATDSRPPFGSNGTYAITLHATDNTYVLTALTSTLTNSSGTYTYDNFGNPNGSIELRFTNFIAGLEPMPLSLRVQNSAGYYEFNRGTAGAAGSQVGSFTIGTTPPAGGGNTGGGNTGNTTATHFRFDGNLADATGTRTGTITGSVTYEAGVSGQAAGFSGNNAYITLGTTNLISDTGPFSVSFWFRPTASQVMVPLRLRTSSTEFATRIGLNASDSLSQGASIYFGFRGGAGIISRDPRFYIQSILNQWVHLTFVYKGGSKTNAASFDLFVNGERLALTTAGTVGGSSNANEIGRDGGGLAGQVAGNIDDLRIATSALTVSDSAAFYAAAPAVTGVSTAPATLVGYRNKVGQTFQFVVTGSTSGSVWGTDVYTDDSAVARAAVHAGVVTVGETKAVSVTILPGQASYAATNRNGVSSSSWGAWTGSYSFAGAGGSTGTATVAPTVVYAPPAQTAVSIGGRLNLTVTVGGVGPFTYQWFLNGSAIAGAISANYVIASASAANAGTYTVRATNAAGTTTVNAGTVTVANAGAPSITLQPLAKVVAPGARFSLIVSASGTGSLSYQWRKDGTNIPGATQNAFEIAAATASHSGSYTCVITNSAGTITTSAATVSVSASAARPANISCRTNVAAGDSVTPGFVVHGTGTKRVLIRAVGPGLGAFGLSGTMADPKLDVYRQSNNTIVASSDNWDAAIADTFRSVGAFSLTAGSRDAAIVVELAAGQAYSALATGVNNSSGIVLIEVYDLDDPATATSRLVNVSVRGKVGTGSDILILGVVVGGQGKRTLLIRGVGPKLAAFGVSGTLADPALEIFDGNNRSVLDNDNWGTAPFVAEQVLASGYVGAFTLDNGSRDAATLALLDPGAYTIQVKGADGGTGEALVEVYDVP